MQVWNVLHAARWKYRMRKWCKNRYLCTIAQLCRAISSQLRHVLTIGKKLVKQQYLSHMSLRYGELRLTSGWDHFVSLGIPANFNGFRVLAALLHGTLLVGVSQTAALNRGRHLYSAGRPSRWALAHTSSLFFCSSHNFRFLCWSVNKILLVLDLLHPAVVVAPLVMSQLVLYYPQEIVELSSVDVVAGCPSSAFP